MKTNVVLSAIILVNASFLGGCMGDDNSGTEERISELEMQVEMLENETSTLNQAVSTLNQAVTTLFIEDSLIYLELELIEEKSEIDFVAYFDVGIGEGCIAHQDGYWYVAFVISIVFIEDLNNVSIHTRDTYYFHQDDWYVHNYNYSELKRSDTIIITSGEFNSTLEEETPMWVPVLDPIVLNDIMLVEVMEISALVNGIEYSNSVTFSCIIFDDQEVIDALDYMRKL